MNVLNPPTFDHVVWSDGINRKPFEDVYSLTPFASGTGVGFAFNSFPSLRDYTQCKGLTSQFQINAGSDWCFSGDYAQIASGQIEAITIRAGASTNVFTVLLVRIASAASFTPSVLNVKIAGWAPA